MKLAAFLLQFLCTIPVAFTAHGQRASTLWLDMVKVDSGVLVLGAAEPEDDEFTASLMHVNGFLIGRHEVTQWEWKEIVGTNPSYHKDCDSCPVENVSWDQIQFFISKLNKRTGRKYRLPSETEWEFAAKGGVKSRKYQFSGSNDIDEVGWNDILGETMPVGRKKPNELGIYDMTGNVAEFTSSNVSDSIEDFKINGYYLKVLKGCSSGQGDTNKVCRLSYRYNKHTHLRDFTTGFRLAHDL